MHFGEVNLEEEFFSFSHCLLQSPELVNLLYEFVIGINMP